MNFKHKPKKVLVTGASGTGKTTYAIQQIRSWKTEDGKPARHLFLFDYDGELSQRTGIKPARRVQEFIGPVILFDPCLMFPGQTEEAFDIFCDYAFTVSSHTKGPKLFYTDELQNFIGTSSEKIPKELRLIMETGRRVELDFMGLTQAPNLIHNRVKNQLTEIVTFQQLDDNARAFIESMQIYGADALAPGDFIRRKTRTGEMFAGHLEFSTGTISERKINAQDRIKAGKLDASGSGKRGIDDRDGGSSRTGDRNEHNRDTRRSFRARRRAEVVR